MKKFLALASILSVGAALLAGPALSSRVSAGGVNTQTGQGIMVNLNAGGTLVAVNNLQYRYNEATAASFFTNSADGTVTVGCQGGPPGSCDSGNQPATPVTPAPVASEVSGQQSSSAVSTNQCLFLDGGALAGHSYTQSATVNGLNGKGNWTFTYSYNVSPTVPSVAPLTAWDLQGSAGTGGQVQIDVTAEIAGESVQQTNKRDKKYSFSLYEPCIDPSTGLASRCSRVAGLTITLRDADSNVLATYYPGSTVRENSAASPVDFAYTTNAGSNGVTSLLQNGDARTILNTDVFAGNNNGGADGSALAWAIMDKVALGELPTGSYTVSLDGTVKGNSASASIPFHVQNQIKIIHPGCGNGQ